MPSGLSSLSRSRSFSIERRADVALEIGEADRRATGRARTGSPSFARSARRAETGKISGFAAEQRLRVLGDERAHLLAIFGALEHVDLVDDDDDLLAPVADGLEERALALGERPIGRRDEQHEVGLRHELAGQPLVLAEDRVGARRVDDVEIAEQRRPAR